MSNDRTLSLSTVTATINAPIEKVNIADWLLYLPDAEYQRCAHAHIAAGATTTDDGRAMSINVESIGDAFVIQHYVAEIREPQLCRMVSISDSISPAGRTKLQVAGSSARRKPGVKHASSPITSTQAPLTKRWHSSTSTALRSSGPATRASRLRTPTIWRKLPTLPKASSAGR